MRRGTGWLPKAERSGRALCMSNTILTWSPSTTGMAKFELYTDKAPEPPLAAMEVVLKIKL
jgi:hypothetical protein